MDNFGALDILTETGLFSFEPPATEFLDRFVSEFSVGDAFEDQFRSDIGSIASAELAVLRSVLTGEGLAIPISVREPDTKVAVETADTLRTRPCRTVVRAREREFTALDLFSLSGDAGKAFFAMAEQGAGLRDLESLEGIMRLGDRLYGNRIEWETANLQEVDFSKFSLFFVFMRLNVFRNEPQDRTLEQARALQRRLGLRREEEAGMQSSTF
jgi:hypothetical protein